MMRDANCGCATRFAFVLRGSGAATIVVLDYVGGVRDATVGCLSVGRGVVMHGAAVGAAAEDSVVVGCAPWSSHIHYVHNNWYFNSQIRKVSLSVLR